ncbi:hypothetical protein Ddc_02048 [Ditylenchus destructor]|nr:hypothetical protein Ddc_02048 [Ditylenchus destructor]
MGGKPTKFSRFYKKILSKKKSKNLNKFLTLENDEGTMLINVKMSHNEVDDSPIHAVNSYANELNYMKRQMNDMLGTLRQSVDQLESEHRKRLQRCIQKCKTASERPTWILKEHKFKKLESQMEECRLRNALVNEKFKNCVDYLDSYDALIRSVQSEARKEDNFLRRLLFKTAKRQYQKSQLNEAMETLCQLIIATGGSLNEEEMKLLFEVSKKKIAYTYEFYERITKAVKQIDDCSSKFVIDELWTSVIEDLRSECSDSFDIVMKVKPDFEEDSSMVSQEKYSVESYKYLLAVTICSLWLQITHGEHDEFEDIKDLFFESLERYIDTFTLNYGEGGYNNCMLAELQKTLNDLLRQYPVISNSKRMKKMIRKIANLKRKTTYSIPSNTGH